jgi:hypothetical protein
MMRTVIFLALGAVALAGCKGKPDEPVQAPADRESVFDPLLDDVDRAKGVQDTVLEQAAEQRRQIEEAEGR